MLASIMKKVKILWLRELMTRGDQWLLHRNKRNDPESMDTISPGKKMREKYLRQKKLFKPIAHTWAMVEGQGKISWTGIVGKCKIV